MTNHQMEMSVKSIHGWDSNAMTRIRVQFENGKNDENNSSRIHFAATQSDDATEVDGNITNDRVMVNE